MQNNKKQIISHIKRLEGQLRAVRDAIEDEGFDCKKANQTLFAASRSFATLRQDFIKFYLEACTKNKFFKNTNYKSVLNLIKG
jgi:DNA-binding FrmR family transcriptional regulator